MSYSVKVIVKCYEDWMFKSYTGVHVLEPNAYELDMAVEQAHADGYKEIYVYLHPEDDVARRLQMKKMRVV